MLFIHWNFTFYVIWINYFKSLKPFFILKVFLIFPFLSVNIPLITWIFVYNIWILLNFMINILFIRVLEWVMTLILFFFLSFFCLLQLRFWSNIYLAILILFYIRFWSILFLLLIFVKWVMIIIEKTYDIFA